MGKGGQHDLASQPDLTDLAEGGQVKVQSASHQRRSIFPHHIIARAQSAAAASITLLTLPRRQRLPLPQAQFDFFAQAVPFLRAATSDELLRAVAEYTRFLEGGARSCPSFAVELVWRTHLLMPAAYAKDCVALAGRVLDHVILPVGVYSLAVSAESELPPCEGLRLAHLVDAMRRQQSFMEKMLARRSAMDAPDYLALCVRQYSQFLALMKRHRGVMLVPTLAIDLMCVPRSGNPSIVSRYYI